MDRKKKTESSLKDFNKDVDSCHSVSHNKTVEIISIENRKNAESFPEEHFKTNIRIMQELSHGKTVYSVSVLCRRSPESFPEELLTNVWIMRECSP